MARPGSGSGPRKGPGQGKPKPKIPDARERRRMSEAQRAQKNATTKMLRQLRESGEGSSDPEVANETDAAMLSGIWDRLIVAKGPWTPADYMNVERVHRKRFKTKKS